MDCGSTTDNRANREVSMRVTSARHRISRTGRTISRVRVADLGKAWFALKPDAGSIPAAHHDF